jgi:hypothetical protein
MGNVHNELHKDVLADQPPAQDGEINFQAELCSLLARIHRDGGHYVFAHGLRKAIDDADLKVANLNAVQAGDVPMPSKELDELLDHIYEYGTIAEGVKERAWKMCRAYGDDRAAAADAAAYERGFIHGQEKTQVFRTRAIKAEQALAALASAGKPSGQDAIDAARDVLAERERQKTVEGWTPEHDDEHDSGDLAGAASAYALYANDELHPQSQGDGNYSVQAPMMWPFESAWWKPTNPRRALVKAGALILAEIERIDRAAIATKEAGK